MTETYTQAPESIIPNACGTALLAILPRVVDAHLRPLLRNRRIVRLGVSIGKPVFPRRRLRVHQPEPPIAPTAHLTRRLAVADRAARHDAGFILGYGAGQGRVSMARTGRGMLRTLVRRLRGGEADVRRGRRVRAGGHLVRRVRRVGLRDDVRLRARVRAPRLRRRVLLLLVDGRHRRVRRGRVREWRVGEHLEGRVEGPRGGLQRARERAGVFRDDAEGRHGWEGRGEGCEAGGRCE